MVNCPSDNPPPQPTYNNVNWGQGNTPSKLYYNNIISMGVSYSWENTSDSNGGAVFCTGLNQGKNDFVKKTKTVTLDALNIDLNNAGGSTIAKMAANQDKYVVTDKVSVYANGMYVGKGKLTDYSINEGSMTNDSITNLTYDLSNEDSDSIEDTEDPVQRTESITVSRDLNSKSYKIEHSYGVSFGDDFDLITEYPLYKNNPSYGSVDGRLALGEQEANLAIYDNPIDYGEYIDLSAYATQEGWSLNVLENGCSGVFSSSSETKDFINGNYSLSKTTDLRYTGEDISTGRDFYEITYNMNWSEDTRNNSEEPCAVVKMQGKIKGIAKNCSKEFNASVFAKSGYDDFIVGGKAKEKVSGFFNYIQENINGVPTGELNDTMFDLKKDECNPSVDRGEAKNDGEIDFSFEMHNCPNYDIENGSSVTNSFEHSKNTGRDFYEITYNMNWSEDTRNNSEEPCAVVKMQGKIKGIAKNCSKEFNASVFAKSGYDDFIVGGKAKEKVSGFFNYIQENINGVPTGELNDTMFDLKKDECNPSVDRGEAKNDGEIDFSFEMHNCPNYDIENGSSVTNSFEHYYMLVEEEGYLTDNLPFYLIPYYIKT